MKGLREEWQSQNWGGGGEERAKMFSNILCYRNSKLLRNLGKVSEGSSYSHSAYTCGLS